MIFFIADVHLPLQVDHPISQAFINFIQGKAQQAEHLYILGDLFDGWLGDDLGLIMYAPIIQVLANYTQKGHKLSICTGNRDFLLKTYFAIATGAQLLQDETEIILGTEIALLLHGDTLCTDDVEYLSLRKTLHDSNWQTQILQKTAAERIAFAQQLKQNSKIEKNQKNDLIMDVTLKGITDLLSSHSDITHIIHGHTHKPDHHKLANHLHRWVVSDWSSNLVTLLCWDVKTGLFLDFLEI